MNRTNSIEHLQTDVARYPWRWRPELFLAIAGATALITVLILYGSFYLKYILMGFSAIWVIILGPFIGFGFYWGTTYLIVSPLNLPISLNQIIGVLFFMSWAWWISLGLVRFPRTRWFWIISLFFLFNFFSAILGQSWEFGAVFARQVLTYYVLTIAAASLITTRKRLNIIIWIVVLYAAFSAFVALAEWLTGLEILQQHFKTGRIWLTPRPFAGQVRINGTLPNSIVFATFGLFALPFCYFLSIECRSMSVRLFILGVTLLISVTALLTYNRQTVIEIGILFFALLFLFRSRYRYFFAVVFTFFLLIFTPIILGQTLARFQQGATGWDFSVVERRDKIMIAAEILKQKPVFGVGLGSFPKVWDEYIPAGNLKLLFLNPSSLQYPDMGYMQLLCETGIVGFIFQIGLLLVLGLVLWRARGRAYENNNTYKAGLCSVLICLLALIFVLNLFQDFWVSPRQSLFYAQSHAG